MPLYHASFFLLTTSTVTIKSRMKQANREMNPRERMKQRARERALKFAQEFFSDWLVEPHPTAAFVIKEAVSQAEPPCGSLHHDDAVERHSLAWSGRLANGSAETS
ncbi:Uncharacterized protein HZ326_24502 [Fusarium oxysporum f. sp. albedinis]|nr:Uncharacterized protein HZ326_24502 [Fusarium oxysporum f. sp. albedinis]